MFLKAKNNKGNLQNKYYFFRYNNIIGVMFVCFTTFGMNPEVYFLIVIIIIVMLFRTMYAQTLNNYANICEGLQILFLF